MKMGTDGSIVAVADVLVVMSVFTEFESVGTDVFTRSVADDCTGPVVSDPTATVTVTVCAGGHVSVTSVD